MIIFIGGSSKENEVARHQQCDGTCFFLPFLRIPILPLHNSKDFKEISAVLGLLEIWTWCSQRACWKNNLKAIRNPQNPYRFYSGIRFAFQNKSNGTSTEKRPTPWVTHLWKCVWQANPCIQRIPMSQPRCVGVWFWVLCLLSDP